MTETCGGCAARTLGGGMTNSNGSLARLEVGTLLATDADAEFAAGIATRANGSGEGNGEIEAAGAADA